MYDQGHVFSNFSAILTCSAPSHWAIILKLFPHKHYSSVFLNENSKTPVTQSPLAAVPNNITVIEPNKTLTFFSVQKKRSFKKNIRK